MRALARLALALVALAVVFVVAAAVHVTTTTEILPARGGTYIEGLVGQPGSLHPLSAPANQCDSDIAALVFSGLTRRDENGHIAPDLAETWNVSPDARVYTFLLRRDARWHDGTRVTVADVIYTVTAAQGDALPVAPWIRQLWQGVTAEQVGDHIVRLTLPKPYAPFLQYTTLGLLPAHILTSPDESVRDGYVALPIGTGPYRIRSRTGERTILESFPDYGGPPPMIPRLEFRYYPDQPSAVAALQRGDVHAVADLAPEQAARLYGQAGISVYWAPRASQTVVLFNLRLPFFEDVQVRHALTKAIDRAALVSTILRGRAVIGDGPFLTSSWANTSTARSVTYDPGEAARLLDRAGWQDKNKDGVRERDNVKLEFGLLTTDDPVRIQVAQRIAQAWTALGAAVEVQVTNAPTLVQDYLQPRRFEAALFGWANIPDDPDPYELWHSAQITVTGMNFTGFASHRADEIMEEARRVGDSVRRRELYGQFQHMFLDQLPAVVLYEPMFAFAVSDKIQRVRLSYIGEPGDRFRHIAEWYTATQVITVTEKHRVR